MTRGRYSALQWIFILRSVNQLQSHGKPPQDTSTCFLHSFWGGLWQKNWFKQTLCYKKIKGSWIYNESKRVLAQTMQLKTLWVQFPLTLNGSSSWVLLLCGTCLLCNYYVCHVRKQSESRRSFRKDFLYIQLYSDGPQ